MVLLMIIKDNMKLVECGRGDIVFDVSWILGFLIGLVVFQVRGVKKILSVLGSFGFILFVLWLIDAIMNGVGPEIISSRIINFTIGGLIGSLCYLIGANISRYMQFGKMSPKILIYFLLLILLLFMFR